MVRDTIVNKLNEHEVNEQEYRIYTTLDPGLQRAAAQAVETGIKLVDDQITKMRTKKVKVGKNKFETTVTPGPQAQVAAGAVGPEAGAAGGPAGPRGRAAAVLVLPAARATAAESAGPAARAAAVRAPPTVPPLAAASRQATVALSQPAARRLAWPRQPEA